MSESKDEGAGRMDPVTGAASAARAANIVTKNSVFQALFIPTAKAYGDHWGQEAKEKLAAAAAAKRQRNVVSHLEAVQHQTSSRRAFSPDPELSAKWMEGAEAVDPIDAELSAAWQGVLRAIGEGDVHRKRLLDAVARMSPVEAQAFVSLGEWRGRSLVGELMYATVREVAQPRRYKSRADWALEYCHRLEELGLLRKPLDKLISSSTVTASVAVIALAGFSLSIPNLVETIGTPRQVAVATASAGMATAFAIGLLLLSAVSAARRPQLTDMGDTLLRLTIQSRQAGSADAPPPNNTEPASAPPAPKPAKRTSGTRAKSTNKGKNGAQD